MRKKTCIKYLVLGFLTLTTFTSYVFYPASKIPPAIAQAQTSCPVQNTNPRVIDGLITAYSLTTNFGSNTGQCIISDEAIFSRKIPTFDELKSFYYTQSKAPKPSPPGLPLINLNKGGIYYYTGDVSVIDHSLIYTKTAVIFIEGKLTIGQEVDGNSDKEGLVFIVQGDVIIDPQVMEIDAVIISTNGKIYTAGAGCEKNMKAKLDNGSPITPLVINGSLISLNQSLNQDEENPIVFCRSLSEIDNGEKPAEIINWQPKYLVILKDLFANPLQKWTETVPGQISATCVAQRVVLNWPAVEGASYYNYTLNNLSEQGGGTQFNTGNGYDFSSTSIGTSASYTGMTTGHSYSWTVRAYTSDQTEIPNTAMNGSQFTCN